MQCHLCTFGLLAAVLLASTQCLVAGSGRQVKAQISHVLDVVDESLLDLGLSYAFPAAEPSPAPAPIPGGEFPNKPFQTGILVGIFVGVASLLLLGACFLGLQRCAIKSYEREEDPYWSRHPVSGMPSRFSFEELKAATRNFSNKLGEGGSGSVFDGDVRGQRVAVKVLDDRSVRLGREFLAEVETIGSIHHVNLVQLVGFCSERSHKLLVYEHMSNGSLDNWIFAKNGGETAPAPAALDWQTRHGIITDVAKGLCYLHEGCRQRIAHLDIKPQNILLDESFNAKISDFGLAKLIDRDRSNVVTRMRGTPGYLAPEWLTSRITEKADVYSFGVVMMEVICGRRNLDLSRPEESNYLIKMLQESARSGVIFDLVASHFGHEIELYAEQVMEMTKLAMWCLQVDTTKRPAMSTVVKALEGAIIVERDIDYNFMVTAANEEMTDEVGPVWSYLPPSSSLSGPR